MDCVLGASAGVDWAVRKNVGRALSPCLSEISAPITVQMDP
jgi:hypothetical protein